MITPSRYSELRTHGEGAAEKIIDRAIREHAKDKMPGTIRIATSLFGSVDIEPVLAKYRAAGWHAEVIFDTRDGDFVQLVQP